MFGSLGFPEILVILVLALMLFGPKRLPEIGRTLGKALGEFRRSTSDLKRSIQTEMTLEEIGTERPDKPRRPSVLRDSESAPPETTPREAAAPPANEWDAEPAASADPADRPDGGGELQEAGEPPPPVLTSFEPEAAAQPKEPRAEADQSKEAQPEADRSSESGDSTPESPARDDGR